MGTNFYVYFDDEIGEHIGKRSAAGKFCCGETLNKSGAEAIHQGECEWHDTCPRCDNVGDNVCSFTWAIHSVNFFMDVKLQHTFIDEYGRLYSANEMLDMIQKCPFQIYTQIGKEFS